MNNFQNSLKLPDLINVLKAESPKLYQKISQKKYALLVALLRKIVDEKALHHVISYTYARMQGEHPLSPLENLSQFLYGDLKVQLKIVGRENIPKETHPGKSLIFASNHSLGIIDGLTLVEVLSQFYGHAYILANRLAILTEVFNSFFIPVGVFTRTKRDERATIQQTYKSAAPISIFPAGLVARKDAHGNLKERPWNKHFLQKAIEFKRDIVPTYLETENSKLFYAIHKLRTALKLKANLEMFLLIREAFNVTHKAITIHFGHPVSYQRIVRHIEKHKTTPAATGVMQDLSKKFCTHVESKLIQPLKF